MSRRDYVLVAKVLKSTKGRTMTHTDLVALFANEFKKDKPTFNADLFKKACS